MKFITTFLMESLRLTKMVGKCALCPIPITHTLSYLTSHIWLPLDPSTEVDCKIQQSQDGDHHETGKDKTDRAVTVPFAELPVAPREYIQWSKRFGLA